MFKEIDMGLVTTHGTFRKGQLSEVIQLPLEAPPAMPQCPFRQGAFGAKCKTNCVMYQDGGCALSVEGYRETLGRFCPFANNLCFKDCALYSSGGCGLLNIARMGRKD